MAKCFKCGNEVNKDSDFCDKCGTKLTCPQCGTKIKEGVEFCEKCGTNVLNPTKKTPMVKKWIIFISILLLVAGIATILILFVFNKGYQLDTREALAYTRLRLAEAQSEAYGVGTISEEEITYLKQMVKNQNSDNVWFSRFTSWYGRTADTDKNQITYLCDDNYCAKFVVEHNESSGKYYLIDYSFEPSTERGYKIYYVNP